MRRLLYRVQEPQFRSGVVPLKLSRFALIVLAAATPLHAGPARAVPGAIVLSHVNVIPMDRPEILADQDVEIEDGTIALIAPAGQVPTLTGRIVDARGMYLLPGLVDFHTHPQNGPELLSYLANGVTTIAAFDGELLDWKRWGKALPADRPTVFQASHIIDGVGGALDHYGLKEAADAPAVVDHERSAGAELVKTYTKMDAAGFLALSREAHARGLPLVGHVPVGVPASVVLSGSLDLVAHSEQFTRYLDWRSSPADFESIAEMVASNRVAVSPTLAVLHAIEDQTTDLRQVIAAAREGFLSPNAYQSWLPRNNVYANRADLAEALAHTRSQYAIMQRMVKILSDKGVLLLLGTDAPVTCEPGDCIHDELDLLTGAGLSNYEALRTATFNPGLFAAERMRTRAGYRFGVVAAGARADLLLLRSNPLDSLAALKSPVAVIAGGVYRSGEELRAERARELPELRRGRSIVDRYESLEAAGDLGALVAFLDGVATPGWPILSESVVIADARRLAAKRPRDGVALIEHARRLMPDLLSVYLAAADLKLKAGDVPGARREVSEALRIAPRNAGALALVPLVEAATPANPAARGALRQP